MTALIELRGGALITRRRVLIVERTEDEIGFDSEPDAEDEPYRSFKIIDILNIRLTP